MLATILSSLVVARRLPQHRGAGRCRPLLSHLDWLPPSPTPCTSFPYIQPPTHVMDVYEFITPDPPAGSVAAGTFLAQHTITGHAVAIRKFPRAAIKYAQREVFLLHFWAERVRQGPGTASGSQLHSNVGIPAGSTLPPACCTQAQAQAQLKVKVPCIQQDRVCPEFGEWFTTRNSIWAVLSWVDGVTVSEGSPAAASWRVPSMHGVVRAARVIAASLAHACSLLHAAGVVLASSIAPWNVMISSAGFPFIVDMKHAMLATELSGADAPVLADAYPWPVRPPEVWACLRARSVPSGAIAQPRLSVLSLEALHAADVWVWGATTMRQLLGRYPCAPGHVGDDIACRLPCAVHAGSASAQHEAVNALPAEGAVAASSDAPAATAAQCAARAGHCVALSPAEVQALGSGLAHALTRALHPDPAARANWAELSAHPGLWTTSTPAQGGKMQLQSWQAAWGERSALRTWPAAAAATPCKAPPSAGPAPFASPDVSPWPAYARMAWADAQLPSPMPADAEQVLREHLLPSLAETAHSSSPALLAAAVAVLCHRGCWVTSPCKPAAQRVAAAVMNTLARTSAAWPAALLHSTCRHIVQSLQADPAAELAAEQAMQLVHFLFALCQQPSEPSALHALGAEGAQVLAACNAALACGAHTACTDSAAVLWQVAGPVLELLSDAMYEWAGAAQASAGPTGAGSVQTAHRALAVHWAQLCALALAQPQQDAAAVPGLAQTTAALESAHAVLMRGKRTRAAALSGLLQPGCWPTDSAGHSASLGAMLRQLLQTWAPSSARYSSVAHALALQVLRWSEASLARQRVPNWKLQLAAKAARVLHALHRSAQPGQAAPAEAAWHAQLGDAAQAAQSSSAPHNALLQALSKLAPSSGESSMA